MVRNGFIGKALQELNENSPAILTGIGVAGVFVTGFMFYKASPKIHYILEGYHAANDCCDSNEEIRENTKQMVKELVPVVLPPIGMAVATSAAIIGANKVSTKRLAVMSAAYAMSSDKLKELKEKTEEIVEPKKTQRVKEAMAQEAVKKNPVSDNQIIFTGDGDVLCLDEYTGRYFKSNSDKIDRAVNMVSSDVMNDMWVSVNTLYDYLGLAQVPMGDDFGWSTDDLNHGLIPIDKTGALSEDDAPVLVLSYDPRPHYNNWNHYN